MAWTYGGVRIYVQRSDRGSSQILPRLQPVSGGTVVQSFGYEKDIRNVTALIVGDARDAALLAFSKDGGTLHSFVGPEGTIGSFAMKSYSSSRTDSTCQTIDTSLPEEAPVYEVEMEFYET